MTTIPSYNGSERASANDRVESSLVSAGARAVGDVIETYEQDR